MNSWYFFFFITLYCLEYLSFQQKTKAKGLQLNQNSSAAQFWVATHQLWNTGSKHRHHAIRSFDVAFKSININTAFLFALVDLLFCDSSQTWWERAANTTASSTAAARASSPAASTSACASTAPSAACRCAASRSRRASGARTRGGSKCADNAASSGYVTRPRGGARRCRGTPRKAGRRGQEGAVGSSLPVVVLICLFVPLYCQKRTTKRLKSC